MADKTKEKENESKSVNGRPKVAVIGAGISGLVASSTLVQKGFDVVLLEASDYELNVNEINAPGNVIWSDKDQHHGYRTYQCGRIKTAEAFPGFPPIDLGADFIHGSNSIVNRLADEKNWVVKPAHAIDNEDPSTITLFLDGKFYSFHDTNHPDIFAAAKAWQEISTLWDKLKLDGDEPTFEIKNLSNPKSDFASWLNSRGVSQNTLDIIDCDVCQTNGSTLGMSGVLETAYEEACWNFGADNYRLEGSYAVLVSHYLEKCVKVEKRLNWPVKAVQWTDKKKAGCVEQTPGVVITSQAGKSLSVNYAVVTVPLTILKDGDIIFTPSLPPKKLHAINTIHMGSALKIVCRFRIPFWREKAMVYHVRGFLSQIWTYSRDPKEDGEECHVGVGFATAALAAQKAHLSDEEVCKRFLHQMDEIFGTDADPKPASSNFMSFVYQHWSRHPYIRGGYSTQTVNTYGLRQDLADPVGGRLFFAGEATSPKVVATVSSAIETGMRAAREVCKAANVVYNEI